MTDQATTSRLLTHARVVREHDVIQDGWLLVSGTTIAAVGDGPPPAVEAEATDLGGAWLLPGFVDLHMHGGGGHDVTRSAADLDAAVAFHRAHGTTRTLVSLVTAPVSALTEQLSMIAHATRRPGSTVHGAHLEGPFLSHARCGAQNPAHLLPVDRAVFARLAAAADGTLTSVTLAPELPGALELIGDVIGAGAVAAIGHTDADYDTARQAIAAGAGLATHLFNGMRPLHHRDPAAVGAILEADLPCEIINDGVHVHPAMTALVGRSPARLVLVTDALDATGAGTDTDVHLGGQPVTVRDGEARLANGSLAGSTLTMDVAFRRAVLDSGLTVVQASAAASTNPARVLGALDRFGRIEPGLSADLVVLDGDLQLCWTIAAGRWHPAGTRPELRTAATAT